MSLTITTLLASALALLLLFLSFAIIRHRRTQMVSIGDGDDQNLAHKIRAHANFTEYVPLALILFALAEIQGVAAPLLALLALLFLAGRMGHAYAFAILMKHSNWRVFGMISTFLPILVLAIVNVLYILL